MTDAAVFVTGATGTVGRSVVHHLAAAGVPVIAAIREPADEERLPPGTPTRLFDFDATLDDLTAALDGADRLFLLRPPAIENVQRYLFPVIDAANARRMRQVAFLSLQGVQANRRTPHHTVEAYLRETRSPFTFLRPNFFMQNLSGVYARRIRERDEIFVPAGRAHTAFIDARDIGRVAAAVLGGVGHIGKADTLSGEQSLTYARVAEIMTAVLGRRITYRRPSEQEYLDELAADGASEDYLAVQKMIHRVVRLNASALPNRAVRRLTGTPAATMEQFVDDYREVWSP